MLGAEGDNLHGECERGAKALAQLRVVDCGDGVVMERNEYANANHEQFSGQPANAVASCRTLTDADELLGHDLDHLLAEEGPTPAFDQSIVRINCVGTVDGHVELGLLVEGAEGDVEALGLPRGR